MSMPENDIRYDRATSVREVQQMLRTLAFDSGDVPLISADGIFGRETYDAVLTFQSRYGLDVDGIVGRNTWNEIQRVYRSTVRDLPPDYQTYIGEAYPGRFLVRGDVNAAVTRLQSNLQRIARNDPSVPQVQVTGEFDETTERAVQAIQRQMGLDPTGAVGPVLWSEISTRGRGY